MNREELLEAARRWGADDRTILAFGIWRTIREEAEAATLSDEEWRELERRIDEHDRDPSRVVIWERVKEEIQTLLARRG